MTTEATNPNPSEETANAAEAGADTALGAAATAEDGAKPDEDEGGKPAESEDKGGDKGGAQEKPAETEGAPEKYDTAAWAMPEGVQFDTEAFEAFEPALRDLNLTQDQAGKLVGVYADKLVPLITQRTEQRIDEQGAELRANLARELQDDPEVGGKKLEESRAMHAKALSHFIPDARERAAFSEFLNESGFGNHRLLMRLTAGAGRLISEASTPGGGTVEQLTESQKFYGKGGK